VRVDGELRTREREHRACLSTASVEILGVTLVGAQSLVTSR
jgi:hypothetical protein